MFFKFDRYTQSSFGQYRHAQAAAANTFGTNYRLNRYNTPTDNLAADSILEEWLPKSAQMLNRLFRNIHKFDSIAGPAVDLISIMPFSDVTLIGVEDPKILEVYEQSLAELHIETLLPEVACEYLVIGRVIGSLLFDKTEGIWTDIILQDPDFCDITNIPLRGYDPKIDLKLSEDFKKFLLSKDPRDLTAKQDMPEDFLKLLLSADRLPLDPASTLYLPRKTFPNDYLGSSIYYRILPFYALEKTLINGTLVGAKRRQRSILHVMIGEPDVWEPDEDEISSIAGMFMRADEDPQGAIVATRNGVATNEVRSGADFWKLSDEWDFLSTAKMRALGINEAFLSGDATYNCSLGDSLIPTENGLLRIDEIAKGVEGEVKDIDLVVGSRYGANKAVKWLNNGVAETVRVTDSLGYSLGCTPKHGFLVLKNNDLDWVAAGDLTTGDTVCISTKPLVRKTSLKLDLKNLRSLGTKPRGDIYKPEYMTPELAFIIGCLVAEGSLSGADVNFYNGDETLIEKYSKYTEETFGLKTAKQINTPKGMRKVIRDREVFANRDCYQVLTCHRTLTDWLKALGLKAEGSTAKDKVVPWCILQADEESQLAFLAAYLECDGSIDSGIGIRYHSSSKHVRTQIQAILNTHGFVSHNDNRITVSLGPVDSYYLWLKLEKYMVTKKVTKDKSKAVRKGFGVPTRGIQELLKSRKVRATRKGLVFRDDQGNEIVFKNASPIFYPVNREKFLYDNYDRGEYRKLLECLKKISEREYQKLIALFDSRYYFSKVESVVDNGKHPVYDLSMKKGTEPAYNSQCFQVHNTMEVALSVFVETLRSFRDSLVSRIFYEKLFPILAEIHGFKRRTQAELDHRIRVEGKTVDSSLIIPQFNFHKQLRPEADTAYLEVLGTMEEKGIPVPLRTWAAAGGLNLEKLLDMEDEDIENRKSVQEWKDKVAKETGGAEPGAGGGEVPPKEGGAWGSLINAHVEAIRKSLDSLPIWINNRFCGVSKDKFVSILKAQNPSKKLIALYKHSPRQLEMANYVLHRMGVNQLPFNVGAVREVAEFLKRCSGIYSPRRVSGEFTFLNKLVHRDSKMHPGTNKRMQELLPPSMGNQLYSGVVE